MLYRYRLYRTNAYYYIFMISFAAAYTRKPVLVEANEGCFCDFLVTSSDVGHKEETF